MVNGLNDNIGQRSNQEMRIEEVAPGKIGDGLFAMIPDKEQERNASDDGLSSEEENLIAQSCFEIRNIMVHKQAAPTFMSRFVADANNTTMLSEGQNTAGDEQESAPRRLRIFHDITQRNAGKSNET